MDKKILVVVVVAVAAMVGGISYLLLQDKTKTTQPTTSQATQGDTPEAPAAAGVDTSSGTPGTYAEYSEGSVASTKGVKILFFHASWCPQCRQLEADIKAGEIPQDVTIFKVDYDTNQALRQKYDVKLQTTLVKIDDAGNEIQKFVAYENPSLEAVKENLL